jgi:hypothetical protein
LASTVGISVEVITNVVSRKKIKEILKCLIAHSSLENNYQCMVDFMYTAQGKRPGMIACP